MVPTVIIPTKNVLRTSEQRPHFVRAIFKCILCERGSRPCSCCRLVGSHVTVAHCTAPSLRLVAVSTFLVTNVRVSSSRNVICERLFVHGRVGATCCWRFTAASLLHSTILSACAVLHCLCCGVRSVLYFTVCDMLYCLCRTVCAVLHCRAAEQRLFCRGVRSCEAREKLRRGKCFLSEGSAVHHP